MTEPRTIYKLPTGDLSAQQVADIRALLWAAFADHEDGGMTEDDWQHSIGGMHFVAVADDQIVAHASVVQRTLHVAGVPVRTGYVEAVATLPQRERHGHGSAVMREVSAYIDSGFDLGALATSSLGFYGRLGWHIWRGPTSVLVQGRLERTPDEDGYIMAWLTPTSPSISLDDPIACEWRPGDSW